MAGMCFPPRSTSAFLAYSLAGLRAKDVQRNARGLLDCLPRDVVVGVGECCMRRLAVIVETDDIHLSHWIS